MMMDAEPDSFRERFNHRRGAYGFIAFAEERSRPAHRQFQFKAPFRRQRIRTHGLVRQRFNGRSVAELRGELQDLGLRPWPQAQRASQPMASHRDSP